MSDLAAINLAILALMAEADRPMHGYELTQAFNDAVAAPPRAPGGKLNPGQIYGILERLQKKGLITEPEVENQEKTPDRYLFRLTEQGRTALSDWLDKADDYEANWREDLFLKLVFARRAPGGDPLEVLRRERQRFVELLNVLAAARAKAQKQGSPPATLMGLELGEFKLKALHDWLDRCEELLAEGAS